MSLSTFLPDDPRLTAYVLGELDPADRAALERQLHADPDLRAAVDRIRETAALMTDALSREPLPTGRGAPAAALAEAPHGRRVRHAAAAVMVGAATVAAVGLLLTLMPPRPETDAVSRDGLSRTPAALRGRATTGDAVVLHESVYSDLQREKGLAQVENRTTTFWGERSPTAAQPVPPPVTGPQAEQDFVPPSADPTLRKPMLRLAEEARRLSTHVDSAQNLNFVRPKEGAAATPSAAPLSAAPVKEIRRELGVEFEAQNGQRWHYFKKQAPGQVAPPLTVYADRPAIVTTAPEVRVVIRDGSGRGIRLRDYDGERYDLVPGLAPASPGTETYTPIVENPFIVPDGEAALSTFSIDVDTASYSNVRRFLEHGEWPPADAVRIEELINYFDYDYPPPPDGVPFSVTTEVAACPWQPEHRLVRIGLKGREIPKEDRPLSNLVFLLDVSGSMAPANKLPLVKRAMELLVHEMNENDRIAIVTYAGQAGLALDSTSGQDKGTILDAIHGLHAGGSTNGEAGIKLAYQKAVENFIENGSNRVILCTDGDFNVGQTDNDELVQLIQDKAQRSQVFLSIFGVGMGNLKDARLEALADKGNGHYGYIDDLREARKVFVEELTGTLYTIAKDVKLQVEFNPAHAGAYRLIGYENRVLAAQDFNEDTKDAGEIGAGHRVTALYEVIPADRMPEGKVDPLKYQKPEVRSQKSEVRGQKPEERDGAVSRELLTVKLRYKLPKSDTSVPLEFPLVDEAGKRAAPSRDFEWAAAVAAFGLVLRDSAHKGQADLKLARELAVGSRGPDPHGRRREFIQLIDAAAALRKPQPGSE